MAITTLLFDLGGVLIDWNPRYVYREYWPDDEDKLDYFLNHVCTGPWNAQLDAGRSFAECVTENKLLHPEEWHEAIEMWHTHWLGMLGQEVSGTADLLRALHKQGKYKLYALTNWSAETFPFARERFHFLNDVFEGIVVSGEIGMVKPNSDIFEHTLKRFNLVPGEVVFIDDSLANAQAARATGMHGIHFASAKQLATELSALGVDVPAYGKK